MKRVLELAQEDLGSAIVLANSTARFLLQTPAIRTHLAIRLAPTAPTSAPVLGQELPYLSAGGGQAGDFSRETWRGVLGLSLHPPHLSHFWLSFDDWHSVLWSSEWWEGNKYWRLQTRSLLDLQV